MTTTNTPDKIVYVPQIEPERPQAEVKTTHRTLYWFNGPFHVEGPYDAVTMRRVRQAMPRIYAKSGWWEKVTRTETIVTEKVRFT